MTERIKIMVVALVLVTAMGACTADRDPPGPKPAGSPKPTGSAEVRCDPALDAAFRAWAGAGFSGSVAVSTGGRFDCLSGYGSANDASATPNTAETVFSIGSVTKAFTAAAVIGLVEDGKVALNDRAGTILPELTGPVARVTVRQLLLHTSGLNGSHGADYRPLDRDAAIAAINRLVLAFPPGSDHVYSNAGYTLLALIIEKVSGIGYREYLASRILRLPDGRVAGGFWNGRPAAPGPRAVGYLNGGRTGQSGDFAGPHWALDGNGGLAMTARDLAEWTHTLFTGRLLSPASVRIISSPGYDLGGGTSETPGWTILDRSVYGKPVLTISGGGGDVGHEAVVAWLPDRQVAVVVMSNKPLVPAGKLLRAVASGLVTGQPLATPSVPAAGSGAAAVAGTYALGSGGRFDVAVEGDRLRITAHGRDAVALSLPPRGVPASDIRDHEEQVLALINGQTPTGRSERASFESAFGRIMKVALGGTVFADGDLRTYVDVTTAARSVVGWFSVNDQGGIRAAEVPAKPPAMVFDPAGGDRYRPADPTGGGPDVTVELRGGRMTVTGAGGTATAKRTR